MINREMLQLQKWIDKQEMSINQKLGKETIFVKKQELICNLEKSYITALQEAVSKF